MTAALLVQLNGRELTLANLSSPSDMASVISALDLKADRIAVELNGRIVSRTAWSTTLVSDNDRLEIVHFVGGGNGLA